MALKPVQVLSLVTETLIRVDRSKVIRQMAITSPKAWTWLNVKVLANKPSINIIDDRKRSSFCPRLIPLEASFFTSF